MVIRSDITRCYGDQCNSVVAKGQCCWDLRPFFSLTIGLRSFASIWGGHPEFPKKANTCIIVSFLLLLLLLVLNWKPQWMLLYVFVPSSSSSSQQKSERSLESAGAVHTKSSISFNSKKAVAEKFNIFSTLSLASLLQVGYLPPWFY